MQVGWPCYESHDPAFPTVRELLDEGGALEATWPNI